MVKFRPSSRHEATNQIHIMAQHVALKKKCSNKMAAQNLYYFYYYLRNQIVFKKNVNFITWSDEWLLV